MYQPDRVFMKDLKRLDKNLGCYFEVAHGHFVITYKRPFGDPIPLFMVEAEDGGFRQPDKRDMNRLHESDTHRPGQSVKEHLTKVTHYMEDYRKRVRKVGRENLRLMTIDDKRQLMSAFAKLWGGKHNSTFRRVNPKQRGKVFAPNYS